MPLCSCAVCRVQTLAQVFMLMQISRLSLSLFVEIPQVLSRWQILFGCCLCLVAVVSILVFFFFQLGFSARVWNSGEFKYLLHLVLYKCRSSCMELNNFVGFLHALKFLQFWWEFRSISSRQIWIFNYARCFFILKRPQQQNWEKETS